MNTLWTYPLTGANTFNIPFDYLARRFVVLEAVDGKDRQVLSMGSDYRFTTKREVILIRDLPSNYKFLEVRRVTDSKRVVDFQDGSILRATDLNASQLQAIHIAEEGREQTLYLCIQYAEAAEKDADRAAELLKRIQELVTNSGWDSTLRQELGADDGYKILPSVAPKSYVTRIPITAMDSYDSSAIEGAIFESVMKHGYAYIPGNGSEYTKYRISNTINPPFDISGARVIVDKMVWIDSNYDNYSFYKTLKFEGRCKFTFRDELFGMTGGEVDALPNIARLNPNPINVVPIDFADVTMYTILGDLDTFVQGAKGETSDIACEFTSEAGKYCGLFTDINVGETISAHVGARHGATQPESSGVMLRGDNGWILFDGFSNGTEWRYRVKVKGQPVQSGDPIQVPEGGLLKSYSASNATVGVSLLSTDTFHFVVNGVSLTTAFGSMVGNIYEIGFVTSSQTTEIFRVTGLNCYTSKGGVFGHAPLNILVRGDSTAEGFISTFDKYLPQLLDGTMGTRTVHIENKAVAGAYMRTQLDELKAEGAGDAYIVIMVGGTNEGQGNTDPKVFAAMVKEFADWCISIGRIPLWVEPWMWYSKEFVDGAGQNSSNYQNVAALREAGKRVMAAYGDKAILVPTTHTLPAPFPHYTKIGVPPLLRDDIHQDELGYKLYAEAIASAIAAWTSRAVSAPRPASEGWSRNNAKVVWPSSVTNHSTSISLTFSGFNNGEVVMQMPRGIRPTIPINVPVMFSSDGEVYGTGVATIQPNGNVSLKGLTTQTGQAHFNATW